MAEGSKGNTVKIALVVVIFAAASAIFWYSNKGSSTPPPPLPTASRMRSASRTRNTRSRSKRCPKRSSAAHNEPRTICCSINCPANRGDIRPSPYRGRPRTHRPSALLRRPVSPRARAGRAGGASDSEAGGAGPR